MDRESFPTLTQAATGWPVLTVPWSGDRKLQVLVTEDANRPDHAIITIAGTGVRYAVEPDQHPETYMTADGEIV